jgi:hypothetical protein
MPYPLAVAPIAFAHGGLLSRFRATSLPPFETAVTGHAVVLSNGGSKLVFLKSFKRLFILEKIFKNR